MAVENQPTCMSICAINQWDWLNYITGASLQNEYWKLVQLVILLLNCSLLPSSEICLGQSHCRQLLLCRSDGHMCEKPQTKHLHVQWANSAENMPVLWHCNFLKSQINVIETVVKTSICCAVCGLYVTKRTSCYRGGHLPIHKHLPWVPLSGPYWPCGPSASDILLLDPMGPLCPTGTHSLKKHSLKTLPIVPSKSPNIWFWD